MPTTRRTLLASSQRICVISHYFERSACAATEDNESASNLEKLCLLVTIGVRSDGRKELVALNDGYRESTESWADLLCGCRRRAMAAPVRAVGDDALGFWKAVREVLLATREKRRWFHKQANLLAALPKSAHPAASAAIKEIYNAEDIDKAQVASKGFEIDYGAKCPKAVAKIVGDADVQLEFYKYPAEHWVHLRTTNPIESTFRPCGCGPG